VENARKGGIVGAVVALLATLWLTIFNQTGPGWREIPETMKIRYQATERSSENWGTPRIGREELLVIKHRLANHAGESFVIREWNTNQWSVKRNLDGTMDRLKELMLGANNGERFLVMAVKDRFTLKVRKVDLNPAAIADTEGTHAIDIVIGTLKKNYPGIRIGGIYVCRTIAGSSTLSQHSYANAVDVFGTWNQMNEASWGLYRMAQAGYVPVSQVLWNNKNLFTGNYVSDHTTHAHYSGSPLLSGGCRRP
jgi:hypothetical protein